MAPAAMSFMRDHGVLKDIYTERDGDSHKTARGRGSMAPAAMSFMRDHGVLKDIYTERDGDSHKTARGSSTKASSRRCWKRTLPPTRRPARTTSSRATATASSLMVAHRPETIASADRVIVLGQGKVSLDESTARLAERVSQALGSCSLMYFWAYSTNNASMFTTWRRICW